MIVVPTPPPPTAASQELAAYIQKVVDAYASEHPELTDAEIVQALQLVSSRKENPLVAVAVVLGVLLVIGVVIALVA